MHRKIVVCIFAKKSVPGNVKTRLAPLLTQAQSAELSKAFLKDIWNQVKTLSWASAVIAVDEISQDHAKLCGVEQLLVQPKGNLGEKMEGIAGELFSDTNINQVLLVGSDTPGLPMRLLALAKKALEKADAVIGPCEDGGFYVLGLKRCSPGLLKGISWSQASTGQETIHRLQAQGLHVDVIEPWFDVDFPSDLKKLKTMLDRREIDAPHTHNLLKTFKIV